MACRWHGGLDERVLFLWRESAPLRQDVLPSLAPRLPDDGQGSHEEREDDGSLLDGFETVQDAQTDHLAEKEQL